MALGGIFQQRLSGWCTEVAEEQHYGILRHRGAACPRPCNSRGDVVPEALANQSFLALPTGRRATIEQAIDRPRADRWRSLFRYPSL